MARAAAGARKVLIILDRVALFTDAAAIIKVE